MKKIIFLFIIFFCALNPVGLRAQSGFHIELSPAKLNLTLEQGETKELVYRIGNYSGKQQDFRITLGDFIVDNKNGKPVFVDSNSAEAKLYSLSKWMNLPESSISVPDQTVVEFKVNLAIPEDLDPGGYYGAVFVETGQLNGQENQSGVGSIGRITGIIHVRVPGEVTEDLDMLQFNTEKKIYWHVPEEIKVTSHLKNKGNVHLLPVGAYNLSGGLGKYQKNVFYNQDQAIVLPMAPFREIVDEISLEGDMFSLIGKYNLELLARYGQTDKNIESNLTFYIIPLPIVIVLAFIIVGSVIITWRVIISFKK